MAKKKLSNKDIQGLLDFSSETGTPFTGLGVPETTLFPTPYETFNNFMGVFKHQDAISIIDNVLPNPDEDIDIVEEMRTDDDNVIRRYRVKKDKDGKEIEKWLIDPVEGVNINDAINNENPYDAQFVKDKLFNMMREDIDPQTGDFKQGVGKNFWENALDNSLTYQLGRLGASLFAGEMVGDYGIGQTFFNNMQFKADGVYYRDQLITRDPAEMNLINEYFGKKVNYEADGFLDTFANTAATFAIDMPLFIVSGSVGSKVLGATLPAVTGASSLPAKFVNHLLQNTMTLGLAQTPSIINHTIESGTDAFLSDMQHLGEFALMASAFGMAGEFAGTGISHLLRQNKNLTMQQATTFLRRNPKIVQSLSGTLSSGGLGYFSTDGSTEDKLATALTFMSMHFANPSAWKSYATKEQKTVVVEKDNFDLLRLGVKSGKPLERVIKETGAEIPRYYEREGNNLYLIDQNKFVEKGVVERIVEEQIPLSGANIANYSFISEVIPFSKKTFKQSFDDQARLEAVKTTYNKKFKDIKNPYDKVKERDAYESFELNKKMSASVLGNFIYAEKLTKALRRNELPPDIKLDKFVNETASFFELPERVFRQHLKGDLFRYIKDPKKFFEEGAYKFTPEEYKKQFVKGFQEVLDAYERRAVSEEINRIFDAREQERNTQLTKRTETQNEKQNAVVEADAKNQEIQNRQEVKKVQRERTTSEQQERIERAGAEGELFQKPTEQELITPEGKRIQSTEGAGLTEAERKTFGKEERGVPVKLEEKVDKIESIPDLNEAIKESNNPVEIVQELKRRFTEAPIEGKREVIKVDEQKKENIEKEKTRTQKRNERRRKVRKLKRAGFGNISLEERAKLVLSKEEAINARSLDKRAFQTLVEDRFLAQREKVRKETKPPESKEEQTTEKIVTDLKKQIGSIEERSKKLEEKLKKEGKSEEEINRLRFEEEGELKSMYDEMMALDMEKHKRLNVAKQEGTKAVMLEGGEIISQPEAASHMKMKFSSEQREKIVDLGVIDSQGKFKSTMIVDVNAYKEALKIIAERGSLSAGLDPTLLFNYAKAGAHLFERGFSNFKSWSAEMLSRFGQGVKKFLGNIWQGAKSILAGEKAIFDPRTLGSTGMQSGKEFNQQRENLRLDKELKEMFVQSGVKGDYKGIVTGKGGVAKAVTFDIEVEPAGKDIHNKSSLTLLLKDKITPEMIRQEARKKINEFKEARGEAISEPELTSTPDKTTINNRKTTVTEPEKVEGTKPEGEAEPSIKTISEEIFAPENKMTSGERKTFKSIVSKLNRYKPKKIKGRLVGTTLTADEHSKLRNIRKIIRIEPKEKEALQNRIVEELAELELKSEHTATDRQHALDMQELFENLTRFGALKEMRGEQLNFANEGLKEIIETGRTKRKIKEEARLKRRDAILQKAIDNIGVPVSVAKARQLGYDVEKPGFMRKLSEFDNRMLGFEHILKKFSKKSDFLADYFYKKQIKDANEKEGRGIRENYEGLQSKLQDIYGLRGYQLSKELASNKERKKTGAFIKEGEERIELELSQNEAYKKWMEWQDPTIRPTMERMGFSKETISELEKYIKPNVMKWAKWQIEEFYPSYYKGVNEAFRERFGVDLPFNKFYSPIQRIATKETVDNPLLVKGSQYSTVLNQHLKMRVNSKAELKYLDGDAVIMKHIAEMEHFKAWVEPVREMRSVFGDKTLRQALSQQQGEKALKILDEFIDDLARGGVDKSKSYELLDGIRRNFTRAVIGMNPVVFVKQLTSFPAFATNIPVKDFIAGISDFASNPKKAMDILMESEMMKSRYNAGAMDRDVKDALSKKINQQLAGARSISDALMLMTKMGDRAAIVFGGWGVYKYHLEQFKKQGMPESQAHKKALREFEVATERMQQSGRLEDLSSIQRTGSIGKLFTMFMTAPNAYYRVASGAFRDIVRGKGSKSENVKKLAIAHFVLPMLFQFAADGFTFNEKRQLRAATLGSLNGLLVIGDWLEAAFAGMQGDFHFGVESTPVIQSVQQLSTAFDKMGKMISEDDFEMDKVLSVADKMAGGISKFAGVPFDTIERSVSAVVEGKDARQILGYSEVALKQTQDDMKKYKRLADVWRKKYKRNPTPENYTTYIEYRRDYRRLLTQLKQQERKEKQQ